MPLRALYTPSSLHRHSRLLPFDELFTKASSSSSSSSSTPLPALQRRFPVPNVSVETHLGAASELPKGKTEAAQSEMKLNWLQQNLQLLSDGKKNHGLNSRSKMPEGSPQWPRYTLFPHNCGFIYDPPNESKLAFVTPDNYCHLCREPVEVAIRHCAWWDHVTRQAAVRLIAIHPRRWDPAAVVKEAESFMPASVMTSPKPHPFLKISKSSTFTDPFMIDMSSCYGFEREAVVRRTELAALLRLLCTMNIKSSTSSNSSSNNIDRDNHNSTDDSGECSSFNDPILRESLFLSSAGNPAANIGERTFRAYISQLITVLLPPMAPEPTTRIQQRCWGRKNLEIMFDFLGIASLQKLVGAPTVAVTKNEKGIIMRQIVYELATVISQCDAMEAEIFSAEKYNRNALDTVVQTRLLVELTLQRLAYELIYLQTTVLMEQAWEVYVKLGLPSEAMVEASSFF
ncbi:uncharacterized protein TM35_000061920 [Trypanosoma theileri]|uniref:Uncharacterized protein n=1 Tax=Trypanosoma theileri TaxID=67003 RepID=A0A1X0P2M9_9TRYP|nr:uncharacterized protein TM35_000061920 [Trypanosoma theileri]ORC91187.1 hypothetical protein TM35_000061920 [Trypanosoma theileri]